MLFFKIQKVDCYMCQIKWIPISVERLKDTNHFYPVFCRLVLLQQFIHEGEDLLLASHFTFHLSPLVPLPPFVQFLLTVGVLTHIVHVGDVRVRTLPALHMSERSNSKQVMINKNQAVTSVNLVTKLDIMIHVL